MTTMELMFWKEDVEVMEQAVFLKYPELKEKWRAKELKMGTYNSKCIVRVVLERRGVIGGRPKLRKPKSDVQ